MEKTYILQIYRGHPGRQYWEEFEFQRVPLANIISSLMEIERNPYNRQGEKVEPIVYESGCLEEVCGSCSMLINGYPRQACTAPTHHSRKWRAAPLPRTPCAASWHTSHRGRWNGYRRTRSTASCAGTSPWSH